MNRKSATVQAFALGVSLAIGTGALAGDATVQEVDRARVCMMQDRVQPAPGLAHTYDGKTYYLCCPMCVSTFDGDPRRYSRASDPVSGKEVDKATAPLLEYQGHVYFFDSETTKAAFAGAPGRFAR